VDEVSPASPAAAAGVLVGDSLLQLGRVTCTGDTQAALAALGPAVAAAEGSSVELSVLRRGEEVRLGLTPQRWAGRGLLGCHLRAC